ncbi:sugar phosphate isomerase/epimerase family protein [Paenibacillus sp. HB172176]|uniref:sugar phosphate isomerase/epimerase family protein n=1 Tax=Paenibacillus sp. HB172176 TaxID=2493690 RepID=UPI001438702A|nr:sugar phosphate isomerase/epimerase family protein [Paenibacillus sp. HB172176]
MNIHLCSISFRHELVSFPELLEFAARNGFAGIELWSVHAAAIARRMPMQAARAVLGMRRKGLEITMISGYVPLLAPTEEAYALAQQHWKQLIALARMFESDKIRIFAGHKSSGDSQEEDWRLASRRLLEMVGLASEHGIRTVIEIHPGTLADHMDSAMRIIREVNHPFIGINMDFLHVWESGNVVANAYRRLSPWTLHYHCKNVRSRSELSIFAPDNVYAPGGEREGMVTLREGALDYREIFTMLRSDQPDASLSLEWFGSDPFRYLSEEIGWIRALSGDPAHHRIVL